jgi:hypothetical protein
MKQSLLVKGGVLNKIDNDGNNVAGKGSDLNGFERCVLLAAGVGRSRKARKRAFSNSGRLLAIGKDVFFESQSK